MATPEVLAFETQRGNKLDARIWRPECKPKAIVVLVHGYGHHVGRCMP